MLEATELISLFDACFPGLTANIERCKKVGFPWSSRPFLKYEKGEVVSHVGLLDYPIFINEQKHSIGALHAIGTKATYRGRGFASELIQEAIDWAQDRYECLVLFTEIPSFYEKRNFRTIKEHRFHLPLHHSKDKKPVCSLTSPKDDALFIRQFSKRAATSYHFWMQDRGTIAAFNTLFATYPTYWSLYFCPAIDAIISFEIKDKTLHLYDIIAQKIPPLELVLEHIPATIDEIYFYFCPDLVTEAACAQVANDPSMGYFMVRGAWPEVLPFTIPPLSRC